MSPRVSCEDCAWSDDADDLLEASDAAEEHEAKEHHRVSIERVATDGGERSDETVYVRGANQGGNALVLHTDRDCSRLSNARTVFSRSRDTYPDDVPVCEWCTGSVERAGGENDGPWKDLEAADPDDLATDGGQDYAWIVTCPHDERIVVEDDLEAAVLDGQGVYDVTIAGWGESATDEDVGRQPVIADGGEPSDADELADQIEAELCSRLWDTEEDTVVFKGGKLAEAIGLGTYHFTAGMARLREREDTRVEIERWQSEGTGRPWEARLAEQRAVADGGADLGVECDVDGCEEHVVGLDDGWEFDRGTVCQSCIDYQNRHGHWPDDDAEICVECRIDDGAVRHECTEAGAVDSVLVSDGEECPYCEEVQRKAMTDGSGAPGGTAAPPEADVDEAPWDWQVRTLTASNLYDDAMREWGERAQIAKASEECAELAAVLARDLNGQANVAELLQEIVDVRIMLEQLARTMGLDQDHLESEVTTRLQHLDAGLNDGDSDA